MVDFIAFRPEQVEIAIEAFGGRVGQYVFISSTSAYEKPVVRHVITEDTPLRTRSGNTRGRRSRARSGWRAPAANRGSRSRWCARRTRTARRGSLPASAGRTTRWWRACARGRPIVCHGDGTSLWVMTAASDFAVGLVGLLGQEGALGEAFHITSDEVLTWQAIYRTIAEAAGAELEMVYVPSSLIAALYPERGAASSATRPGAWSSTTRRSAASSRPTARK